jgi:AcrR family transcriptional regulator
MPKETFFNLPESKREAILDAALDEFAAYPYDQASVNRIVARAGIPKGSFYQYFENKKDLYLYLLRQAGEAKVVYLAPIMNEPTGRDFFTLLRDLYAAGIQFAVENPRYAALGQKLMESRGTPIYVEVVEANTATASEFFEERLRAAIERGQVRADIDVAMFAYLIASMHTVVMEYYLEHVSQAYDDRLSATVGQFIDFLKHGLAPTDH